MPKNNSRTTFQDKWLDEKFHPEYFWVRKAKSQYDATCYLCRRTFDFSNMGGPALNTHAEGKKHNRLVEDLKKNSKIQLAKSPVRQNAKPNSDVQPPDVETSEKRQVSVPSTSGSSMTFYVSKNDVIDAEIYWALDHVSNKSSLRSACNSSKLFPKMFKDSEIAKKFQMVKDKLSYSVTFGLGPYFRDELLEIVRLVDFLNVSFDESLNKIAQKGQMDIMFRFLLGDEVVTRYFSSTFLGHAKASDLLYAFKTEFAKHGIDIVNLMTQLSMDGPNVNKKFRRELCESLEVSQNSPGLIDTGTCILHIVNNSYKKGHAEVDWNVNDFLRVIYYLFKDFPTRRADFIHFTCTTLFALNFCFIRWLENAKVMQRALSMVDPLKTYVEAVEKNLPESNNFHKLKISDCETNGAFFDERSVPIAEKFDG
ncbi:hypothetical protein QAD02_003254 [Eretmocerus hayati]|uniref:Uncharacterized protein n=1 Tax=Eretmocerus hayati TaxID=131215 RepID=A0ACC2NL67_9HYME|nr:hypothetical protein QAD02_003254 [Eretmocerus hayati]